MDKSNNDQINDRTWGLLMDRFDQLDDKQDKVLVQVTLTNGRVSKLERWRSYITGAVAILSILFLAILSGQVHIG